MILKSEVVSVGPHETERARPDSCGPMRTLSICMASSLPPNPGANKRRLWAIGCENVRPALRPLIPRQIFDLDKVFSMRLYLLWC